MRAKYPGTCPCGRRIEAGQEVDYRPELRRVYCVACAGANTRDVVARLTRAQDANRNTSHQGA